ncbi:Golgi membrane protein 1-like [Hyla sarda]|uniref:Golgi membrane protein 1-like n=1 Tax=Hyla sarda TaxID=327740 RepID=UPI0024C2B860|nr:Golgi membrane protein 1-like [Hyla sarda]
MKRLQDIHTIQTDEQRSICEKERADLLHNLSTKDDATAELQSEYENLKQRFENLMSVMKQFEKNQSRLLEKFSTQSTQCMNVINKISELCSKGKGALVQKTAQVTKLNETSVKGAQPNNSTVLQDFNRINRMQMTVLLSSSPPTKATTHDLDHGKQSSLKAMQKLQEQVLVLNSTTSTKDNEDELIEYENKENSTEENNVLESQTEMGEKDDKTSAKNELPKNTLLKEIKSQTQAAKLAEENETPFDLNEVSESETPSDTMGKKVNNLQNPNILKNENLLTNQDKKTADRVINTKGLAGKLQENITQAVDNTKEGRAYSTGKSLEDQRKPQRLTLEKVKTPGSDIYKAIGESEYENNTEDMANK